MQVAKEPWAEADVFNVASPLQRIPRSLDAALRMASANRASRSADLDRGASKVNDDDVRCGFPDLCSESVVRDDDRGALPSLLEEEAW
jgi:hypothetical protein